MITLQSLLLPTASDQLIGSGGRAVIMMQTWMRVIQGRTGGTAGVATSSGENLTASGNNVATSLVLTDDFNFIHTAPVGSGVQLAALITGQQQWVFNRSINPILIYPSSGGQIDTLGINATYSLASAKAQVFTCEVTNQVYSLQLG